MFLEHFGLKERPFGKSPDPRFLFLSPAHSEALARLEYAAEEREIMLLTGGIGCGKTTLTRALVDRLEGQATPVLIHNPRISASDLIVSLVRQLEMTPSASPLERLEQLQQRAYDLHQAGKPLLLIIDEAQLIPERAVFDEIRLLSNFQLDDDNLLSILLVGQPELRDRLQRPALAALAQRIGMRFHLAPLGEKDSAALIRFRVETAGGAADLFTDDALRAAHATTGGIPRLLGNVCALALLEAFGHSSPRVEAVHMETAAEELQLDGTAPPPAAAHEPASRVNLLRRRGRPQKSTQLPPAAPLTRLRTKKKTGKVKKANL